MSRTDTHAPAWVKERDPGWWYAFHEHHDHTGGACDLAEFLNQSHDGSYRWAPGRCRIDWHSIGRNHFCGCRMCTDHDGRRLARKQERVAWRSHRARILADVDRSDVDVPPLHGGAW